MRDALPPQQQAKLMCADLLNEGFLRQSSFSKVDRYCSPARQVAMLAVLLHFMDRADAAVAAGVPPAKLQSLPLLRQLQRLGGAHGVVRAGVSGRAPDGRPGARRPK